jgi:predicted RNase H-like HicB family nuclease
MRANVLPLSRERRSPSFRLAHIARAARRLQRLVRRPVGWYSTRVTFTIELEREEDGRWAAEVPGLPGVMCYGADRNEAVARVQALALRVIAERLEHQEAPAKLLNVTFQAA